VRIDVTNAPPAARDDAATSSPSTAGSGGAVIIGVLVNDSDADGDTVSVLSATAPANGSVVVNGNGTITYTAGVGFTGTDTFTYVVADGMGGGPPRPSRSPCPTRRRTRRRRDRHADRLARGRPGARQRPGPQPRQPLAVIAVGVATSGSAVRNGDGTITYTPAAGFQGTATFTYTVSDGQGGTDTATVSVVVSGAAPVALDDRADTGYLQPVTVPVLLNDLDPNGDPLTVSSVTQPPQSAGTATTDGSTVTFRPAPGFSGAATFGYTVSDGTGQSSTATVTVEVANAPPTAGDDAADAQRGQPVRIAVLANDTDPNRDRLRITSLSRPSAGTAVLDGDTVVFTPPTGQAGTFTFRYEVADGRGGTDTAVVTVTVDNVAPVAADDSVTASPATPGGGGRVTVPVLANDTDPDGDPLRVVSAVNGAPANGTVVVNGDGTITYTAAPGFVGTDDVTYTISDGQGGTHSATVFVTVPNAAPVAADDDAGTAAAEPVRIPVLANDRDANPGQVLRVSAVGRPSSGAAVLNPDGTITYVPTSTFEGTATFTYTVSDGAAEATATVTVRVSGAAPVAVDDTARTTYGTQVTVVVLANDLDPNGDPLRVVSVSEPTSEGRVVGTAAVQDDGTVAFRPADGFSGAATFTYTLSDRPDGSGQTSTGTVRVEVANGGPAAADDRVSTRRDAPITVEVLANDTDPNGDVLAISGVSSPTGGGSVLVDDRGTATTADDAVVFTPPSGRSGTFTFTYVVSDARGGSDVGTVTVTVPNATPRSAPTWRPPAPRRPGRGYRGVPVLAIDSDDDGDRPSWVVSAVSVPPSTAGRDQRRRPPRRTRRTPASPAPTASHPTPPRTARGSGTAPVVVTVAERTPEAVGRPGVTAPDQAVVVAVFFLPPTATRPGQPLTSPPTARPPATAPC
jgi:hypothetical protein